MPEFIFQIDKGIISCINCRINNEWLDLFSNTFTIFGYFAVGWIILFTIISVKRKDKIFAAYWGAVFSACFIISDLLLKNIVRRERPFNELEGIILNTIIPSSFSFPSGHALFSGAACYIITRVTANPNKRWMVYFTAVIVSVSRIFLKVHYPTDVAAGFLLGLLIAFIMEHQLIKRGSCENCR